MTAIDAEPGAVVAAHISPEQLARYVRVQSHLRSNPLLAVGVSVTAMPSWPGNLRLEGGCVVYDRWTAGRFPPTAPEKPSIITDLRSIESSSDADVFAFVDRWGSLGVGGQRNTSNGEIREPTEDYRYCARMVRELYRVGVLLMRPPSNKDVLDWLERSDDRAPAQVVDEYAALTAMLRGGFIARHGAPDDLSRATLTDLPATTNHGLRSRYDALLSALVTFSATVSFSSGQATLTVKPEITPYWDARLFDPLLRWRTAEPAWTFIPLVMAELIGNLRCDNAWCLACKQPFNPGEGSKPRQDRCCSVACQKNLERERKRRYWATKGKFLGSQQDKGRWKPEAPPRAKGKRG